MKGKQHRVLTLGPDMEGCGGIASVLKLYSRHVPGFAMLATNSHRGFLPGLVRLGMTFAAMPFYRLAGYDVAHVHSAMGKSYVRKKAVLGWARALGFKTIFHCHAGGFKDYVARVGRDKIMRTLHRCDAVVALTPQWAKYFSEDLACKTVFVIDNIVEPLEVPDVKRPVKVHGDTINMLFIGKVCKEKGIYELLDAIKEIERDDSGAVHLVIAGPGDAASLNSEIAARGLSEVVEYVGPIYGDAKDRHLREADLLVLPSYFEGLPIVLLEAGVYGLPSLATAVGGIPELISDGVNGFLCEPKNVEALVATIRRYIADPSLLGTQGIAAAQAVRKYYPEAVVAELEQLYKSI